MTRRTFISRTSAFLALLCAPACARGTVSSSTETSSPSAKEGATVTPLSKPKTEWASILPSDRYRILFEEGTERPWSSALNKEKREGTFVCAACFLPLFEASSKYESGTGWPSFFQPIEGHIGTKKDFKLVVPRTEYHCARCGGHQGHVFNDGPDPTGQRWCNNGLSLEFYAKGTALPELRS